MLEAGLWSQGVSAQDASGGFHGPTIDELFPDVFAFAGTPFELTAIQTNRFVMVAVLALCAFLYVTRAKIVPGRAQAVFEMGMELARQNIAYDTLGKTMGKKYEKYIITIFFAVFFLNISGIIPGLNLAGSALPGVPLILALFTWALFIVAGIRQQGGWGFFKSQLFPPGIPKPVYLLLTPIEAASTFIIRPFTLFVRLLANMIAGHFMLALALIATHYFYQLLSPWVALTFASAIFVVVFELLVAFLQAYIFALLTAVYIDLSVHAH